MNINEFTLNNLDPVSKMALSDLSMGNVTSVIFALTIVRISQY